MNYTVKIEQTHEYPKRMKYLAVSDSFVAKDCDSLSYVRGVRQPYGWILESGTPPFEHLDAIVMTDREFRLGDTVTVKLVGVFCRNDGDHKLVAVTADRGAGDLSELTAEEREDLRRLYPYEAEGEGWFGRERAEEIIKAFFENKVSKTIITVQHTQSVHHTNRHAGAWGNWDLTELGRRQAEAVGKFLEREGCGEGYTMYMSDLNRAYQTAEEINKTLGLTPIVTDVIREVNAGAGNGQTWEWFDANKIPRGEGYDVDYRPFPDAESDRDLWARLYPFYQEIISNDRERILIVSHGTALAFLQSMIMGQTLADHARFHFKGPSGSVSRFEIEKDGRVTARYINRQQGEV